MPSVSALWTYPLKSAAGIAVDSFELDRFGPAGDRRWMLVDDNRRFVSQREDASLARIRAVPEADGLRLQLDDVGLSVPVPQGSSLTEVVIWGDRVRAADAGDDAAGWLSEVLGRPLRMVYMADASYRYVDGRYASSGETVSFADGFPLLLISSAALANLNAKLSVPVGMDRFRPNLVIDGCEPHAEDAWKRIRIGELVFEVAKPCARCVVPSIDQHTGERDSEILRVLAGYRCGEDRQVFFGQNLLYGNRGRLAVGDEVKILD